MVAGPDVAYVQLDGRRELLPRGGAIALARKPQTDQEVGRGGPGLAGLLLAELGEEVGRVALLELFPPRVDQIVKMLLRFVLRPSSPGSLPGSNGLHGQRAGFLLVGRLAEELLGLVVAGRGQREAVAVNSGDLGGSRVVLGSDRPRDSPGYFVRSEEMRQQPPGFAGLQEPQAFQQVGIDKDVVNLLPTFLGVEEVVLQVSMARSYLPVSTRTMISRWKLSSRWTTISWFGSGRRAAARGPRCRTRRACRVRGTAADPDRRRPGPFRSSR